MAYTSGTAASAAALISAIESAATAAGWSISSGVMSKDTAAFALKIVSNQIEISGGLGASGATLTTPCPGKSRMLGPYVTFPISYEVFTFDLPSEVYVVISHGANFYQQLSFGVSDVAGNEGSPWFTSACNSSTPDAGASAGVNIITTSFGKLDLYPFAGTSTNAVGLFMRGAWSGEVGSSFFYIKGVSTGWRGGDTPTQATGMRIGSSSLVAGLLNQLPSLSTGATVLLPVKAGCDAGSNGFVVGVNLRNARLCRIDNLEPGQTVQYGGVAWKVFPWVRKNLTSRNGANNATGRPPNHSGTYGYAIRYEGP